MEKAKIDRINELARKSKSVGLTDEERVEQHNLRQEFLAEIRADVKSQLECIEIVDGDKIQSQIDIYLTAYNLVHFARENAIMIPSIVVRRCRNVGIIDLRRQSSCDGLNSQISDLSHTDKNRRNS